MFALLMLDAAQCSAHLASDGDSQNRRGMLTEKSAHRVCQPRESPRLAPPSGVSFGRPNHSVRARSISVSEVGSVFFSVATALDAGSGDSAAQAGISPGNLSANCKSSDKYPVQTGAFQPAAHGEFESSQSASHKVAKPKSPRHKPSRPSDFA